MIKFFIVLLYLLPTLVNANEWPFAVYLDGREIGRHTFTLNQDKHGARLLKSSADFKVKLLFIEAYRYLHVADEIWQGDCLASLTARTEENDEITALQGKLVTDGFMLSTAHGNTVLPACVMTFAYWNPLMLTQQKLLNPQTGEWQSIVIRRGGRETLTVRGKRVKAERYRLEAPKLKIDLWYSSDWDWLALQSTTPEGYVIRYKLL